MWLRKPLGCPAQGRLLLTDPGDSTAPVPRHCPDPRDAATHPHLNPSDLLSNLTMNLSAVGGSAVWGVSGTAMPGKPYCSSWKDFRDPAERGLLLPHSAVSKGMAGIRVKQRNTQQKLLNPS